MAHRGHRSSVIVPASSSKHYPAEMNLKKLRQIGSGSFGKVYVCQDATTQKEVVAKEIDLVRLSAPDRAEAKNEAVILRQVKHSSIISLIGAFQLPAGGSPDTLVIVMEYIASGDLRRFIDERKCRSSPIPQVYLVDLFNQLMSALAYLHGRFIGHRDIKPGNILVTPGKVVKLCDFGSAYQFSGAYDLSRTSCGTPFYLAPEMINPKQHGHNYSVDIWSAACVLFEMLTFSVPFPGTTNDEVFRRALQFQYCKPLESIRSPLAPLIRLMMKQTPAERPDAIQILQLIPKLIAKQQVRVTQAPITFASPLAVTSRVQNRLVPLIPRSAEVAWTKPKALPRIHSQSAAKPKPSIIPLPVLITPNRLSSSSVVKVVCEKDFGKNEVPRDEITLNNANETSAAAVPQSFLDTVPATNGEVSSNNKTKSHLTAAKIAQLDSTENQRSASTTVSSAPASGRKRVMAVRKQTNQHINNQMIKHIEACIDRDRKRRGESLGKRKVEEKPDETLAPNPPKLLRLTPESNLSVNIVSDQAPTDAVKMRKLATAHRNGSKRLTAFPIENVISSTGAAAVLDRKRHVSSDLLMFGSKIPRFIAKSAKDVNNNDSSRRIEDENQAPKKFAADTQTVVIDDSIIEIAEKLRSNGGKVTWQIAVDLTCGKISKTQIAEAFKIVFGVERYEQARDKLFSGVYEHANEFMVQLDSVEQDAMVCLMLLCR